VNKDETIGTIQIALHMLTGPTKFATAQSPVGEDEVTELSGSGVDEEWLD
jgi:hypothetical protein